jgi:hypothetical protein
MGSTDMLRGSIVAALIALLVPSIGHAQPADMRNVDDFGLGASSSPTARDSDERSPVGAGVLSAGTTLGGALALVAGVRSGDRTEEALGAVAFAVGPTVGHWYAGERWSSGLGLRLGGAVAGAAGVGIALTCTSDARDSSCSVGNDLMLAGAALYVVGAVYEIATAPGAAHDHNLRVRDATFTVAPLASRDGAVPGLVLAGRF